MINIYDKEIDSLNPDELLARLLINMNLLNNRNNREFDIIKNKLLDELKFNNDMIDYDLLSKVEKDDRLLFAKILSLIFYFDKLSLCIVKYPLTLGIFRNLFESSCIKSSVESLMYYE